jgi:diguanylate cyclase (GGDEF)-like protein
LTFSTSVRIYLKGAESRPARVHTTIVPFVTSSSATLDTESQAAQVLRDGFRWLRFPQPLETLFREHHLQHSYRLARIGLLAALIPTLGFAFADRAIFHIVAVGFQLPVLLICIATTTPRLYTRWHQSAAMICGPIFGLGSVLAMILMTRQGHGTDIMMIGSRLLLIAFFFYFVMALRVSQALCCNAIIFAGVIVAIVAGLIPQPRAGYLAFVLLGANLIGSVGAFALERANRTAFLDRMRLETLAARDGLTQLLNRQAYEQYAENSWQDSLDMNDSAAVIMIDVDYFKSFNDHYGHQAGDDCLRRIARAVHTAVGELYPTANELVGRYGGEEMIAMVFNCPHEKLNELCNSILTHVTAEHIPHAASNCSDRVSVSVGAALHQSPLPTTHKALTHAADRALYAAKSQGRNRAVILTTVADATLVRNTNQRPSSRMRPTTSLRRLTDYVPRGRVS